MRRWNRRNVSAPVIASGAKQSSGATEFRRGAALGRFAALATTGWDDIDPAHLKRRLHT